MNKFFPTTGTFDILKKVYIWGYPLEYSLSIFFQEHISSLCNRKIIYSPFRGDEISLKNILKNDLCVGSNVTMPFKIKALSLCDQLTDVALKAGSVNTIYKESGNIIGDNTDGAGLYNWMTIKNKLKNKIQITGNGGSARAIASFFSQKGIAVTVCARSQKGWEKNFGKFISIEDRDHSVTTINTLPFTISGDDILDINYKYGAVSETACGMLACQGALSFEKWFQEPVPIEIFVKLAFLHARAHSNRFLFRILSTGTHS